MIESKALKVEYLKLNPTCAYCQEPASIIRVMHSTTGDTFVATMCEKDANGERAQCIEDGWALAGQSSVAGMRTDAVLFNTSAFQGMADMVDEIGDIGSFLEGVADDLNKGEGADGIRTLPEGGKD